MSRKSCGDIRLSVASLKFRFSFQLLIVFDEQLHERNDVARLFGHFSEPGVQYPGVSKPK